MHTKLLPPHDGNELDTTKREEEERQAMKNMVWNIQRCLTIGQNLVEGC